MNIQSTFELDKIDQRIIAATQEGLPLVSKPYETVAKMLGLPNDLVIERLEAMLQSGAIRRIGVVPNHYKLGFTANGMSVWDVDNELVDELGDTIGALEYVSHCYRRPRHLPLWPYNMFAMVHGRTRIEVEEKIEAIAKILGPASRQHNVLYSTKILKKTGVRLCGRSKD